MEVSGQLHTPRFTPRERALSTHWIGGWVGLRTGMGGEEINSHPVSGLEPPITETIKLSNELSP